MATTISRADRVLEAIVNKGLRSPYSERKAALLHYPEHTLVDRLTGGVLGQARYRGTGITSLFIPTDRATRLERACASIPATGLARFAGAVNLPVSNRAPPQRAIKLSSSAETPAALASLVFGGRCLGFLRDSR